MEKPLDPLQVPKGTGIYIYIVKPAFLIHVSTQQLLKQLHFLLYPKKKGLIQKLKKGIVFCITILVLHNSSNLKMAAVSKQKGLKCHATLI